mmetsp:Transcript_2462/g.7717  ORF Transcript_2462/g.7717 Transcript_2462/m.7717 type:complete len:319 (+) Transcript_2462:1083-2039(+)
MNHDERPRKQLRRWSEQGEKQLRKSSALRQQKQRSFSSPLSRPSFPLHLPPPLPPLCFVPRSISPLLLLKTILKIRLEAFRAQQRKESQQESIKKADKRRGAEPELMEGWIKVKREGPLGGWQVSPSPFLFLLPPSSLPCQTSLSCALLCEAMRQRKMLVLRSTGLLLFNDENRSGGCSNAFGLEIVSSIARKKGTCVEVKFQGRGSDWWEKSSCSRQPRTTPDVTSSPFCPPLSLPLSSPPHLHPRPRPFSCSTLGSEHILIALIPSSDSSSCEWDLGSSQSVDKWIAAIETALIRCRRMTLDIRPREITEEEEEQD